MTKMNISVKVDVPTPDCIEFYFKYNNWFFKEKIHNYDIYYNKTLDREVAVVLDTKFADYAQRCADFIEDLAIAENKSVATIISSMFQMRCPCCIYPGCDHFHKKESTILVLEK